MSPDRPRPHKNKPTRMKLLLLTTCWFSFELSYCVRAINWRQRHHILQRQRLRKGKMVCERHSGGCGKWPKSRLPASPPKSAKKPQIEANLCQSKHTCFILGFFVEVLSVHSIPGGFFRTFCAILDIFGESTLIGTVKTLYIFSNSHCTQKAYRHP